LKKTKAAKFLQSVKDQGKRVAKRSGETLNVASMASSGMI
jgi:hypothetical protein